MKIENLNTRLQILASVGVIIGLFIVAYELKQTKDLAQAQIMDQTYTDLRNGYQNLMGENPASSITKACTNPSELSPEDIVILSAHLSEQYVQIIRWYKLEEVADFGIEWKVAGIDPYRTILSTQFGRAWFTRAKEFWPSELAAYGDELLESNDTLWTCETVFKYGRKEREVPK